MYIANVANYADANADSNTISQFFSDYLIGNSGAFRGSANGMRK